jgi:hypothetical protein
MVKYEAASKCSRGFRQFRREKIRLRGRYLHLWSWETFHRNEEVLAAVALKAVLSHVVGKIGKFGPRLCLDPFPRKEAGNQGAREGKESQVSVEQTKDYSESNSEKYGGHGNPNVIDIDRTETQDFSKQARRRRDHGELLGILAFALGA